MQKATATTEFRLARHVKNAAVLLACSSFLLLVGMKESAAATWVEGHTVTAAWIEGGSLLVYTQTSQGGYSCAGYTNLFVIQPSEGNVNAGLSIALTALMSGKKVGFLIGVNGTCPWGGHDAASIKLWR
jgi:hypothetical protein